MLILAGGYVEGNVTGELSQLGNPLRIVGIEGPSKVDIGVKFPVNITVENSGVLRHGYFFALYGSAADRVYEEAVFPPGRTTVTKETTIYAPGSQNVTAAILHNFGTLSSRDLIVEVKEPSISILNVEARSSTRVRRPSST